MHRSAYSSNLFPKAASPASVWMFSWSLRPTMYPLGFPGHPVFDCAMNAVPIGRRSGHFKAKGLFRPSSSKSLANNSRFVAPSLAKTRHTLNSTAAPGAHEGPRVAQPCVVHDRMSCDSRRSVRDAKRSESVLVRITLAVLSREIVLHEDADFAARRRICPRCAKPFALTVPVVQKGLQGQYTDMELHFGVASILQAEHASSLSPFSL